MQLELKFIGIIKKLFFGWIILIPILLGPAHELVNLNIFLHILESKIDKEKVNECNKSHIKVVNPNPYKNEGGVTIPINKGGSITFFVSV